MKRKMIARILIFAMLFTFVPSAAMAEDTTAASIHKHTVCKDGANCTHALKHSEIEFEAWFNNDAMPTAAGNYYLTADVTLSSSWVPMDGTTLCLNGHKLLLDNSQVGKSTIQLALEQGDSVTFTLCDCKGNGTISHKTGKTGSGVNIGTTGSNFYMYGGNITGNNATSGGGVVVSGTFYMYGGSITKNQADFGGGVYVASCGKMILAGKVKITGNTVNNTNNNVLLNVDDDVAKGMIEIAASGLDQGSQIGITLGSGSNSGDFGAFTTNAASAYASYFMSDSCDYKVEAISDSGDDAGKLKLVSWSEGETKIHTFTGPYVQIAGTSTHQSVCGCGQTQTSAEACSGGTVTCTAKAICEECNTEYGDVLGHNWSTDWTNDANSHWQNCLNSNCPVTENTQKNGYAAHTLEVDPAVAPTCSATGLTEGKHCSECNEVLIEQTVVDALGHNFVDNNTCDRCGYTKPSTGGGGFSGTYNYPIIIGDSDGAAVTLSDNNAIAGETVAATVTPDNGYGVAEVIVTDEDGNVIPVTYLGGGEYSFVMPAGKVSIQTICKPAIILTVGKQTANVFGKTITIDAAPIITAEGRTMLPIRFVAEALGADVDWNEDAQTVTITKGDTVVKIIIGADYAYINGKKVKLDSPAFIANGRTYLPVRFVSEALGADVNWDAKTQQVVILK